MLPSRQGYVSKYGWQQYVSTLLSANQLPMLPKPRKQLLVPLET